MILKGYLTATHYSVLPCFRVFFRQTWISRPMQLFWYVFLDSLPPVVILLSVCLSVFLSVCVFFHPSSETEPFICLCLPLNGSTRLTLGPSLRPSLCVSINLSVLPSDHSSVRPSLCVCPSVRLSIRLSVRLFVYLSIIGNGTFSTPFPAVLSSLRRNYCGKQMNSVSFTF